VTVRNRRRWLSSTGRRPLRGAENVAPTPTSDIEVITDDGTTFVITDSGDQVITD
jgi:hypothetical protein